MDYSKLGLSSQMKNLILIFSILMSFTIFSRANGNNLVHYSDVCSSSLYETTTETVSGVVLDNSNNFYVAGTTDGNSIGEWKGGKDNILMKYNHQCREQWATQWGTTANDNIKFIRNSGNSIFVYSIGSFGYSVHKNQYCNSGVIRSVPAATFDNCMTLCDNNPSCRTFEWYSGRCRTSTTCRHTNFKTERGKTIYQKGSMDSEYSVINKDCYTKYANPYSTDWFGNRGI